MVFMPFVYLGIVLVLLKNDSMSFSQLLEVEHRHCERVHLSFSFSGNLVLLKPTANDVILFSCFIFSSMLRISFCWLDL